MAEKRNVESRHTFMHQFLKILVLTCSISLVSIYIAYRSGYFNRSEKGFRSLVISMDNRLALPDTGVKNIGFDSSKKLQKVPQLTFDLDKLLPKLDWEKLLQNNRDTIEIPLPDSLFEQSGQHKNDNHLLVKKEVLENHLMQLLQNRMAENKSRMSSTKSMVIFDPIVKFTNRNFKFVRLVNYDTLPRLSVSVPPVQQKPDVNTALPEQPPYISSSKYGKIIDTRDIQTIFSKKQPIDSLVLLKDTVPIPQQNKKERLRGSKSAILFEPKDIPKKKDSSTPHQ